MPVQLWADENEPADGYGGGLDPLSGGMFGFDRLVTVMVVAFAVLFLLVLVGGTVSARRRRAALRRAGLDPNLTGEEQVAAQLRARALSAQGEVTASPTARGVEERLRELDDLLAREVITPDEHREARARVIAQG